MTRPLLLVFISYCAYGQQFFSNPSMEGPSSQGTPPSGWNICLPWSTPDTQPGIWSVTLPASNGSSYISIVTRGTGGYANDGLSEATSTALVTPLQQGTCYVLYLDVAYFPQMSYTDWDTGKTFTYDTPATLNIWSTNASCALLKSLYRSSAISNTNWQTLRIPITPTEQITHLMFQADYYQGNIQYGNILIDNARLEPVSLNLGSDATLCAGETRQLSVTIADANVEWNNGVKAKSLVVSESGTYKASVEKFGCLVTDEITIVVLKKLERLLPRDTVLCPADVLRLDATTPMGEVKWHNGSTSAVMEVRNPGYYEVVVNNGCERITEGLQINFDEESCCNLFAPNVFTPNADAKNDTFEVSSDSGVSEYHLVIYNRWGKVVFTSESLSEPWNGLASDKEVASQGIYFWKAVIGCNHTRRTTTREYRGSVTLLR